MRFAPETLSRADRAFLESVEGLHHRIEALKVVFPEGRLRTALEAMQEVNARLVAAAISQSVKH